MCVLRNENQAAAGLSRLGAYGPMPATGLKLLFDHNDLTIFWHANGVDASDR